MTSGGGIQTDYELFLNALLHGDRRSAVTVARKYAGSHNMIKFFYDNIVKSSLYRVGELWEYNSITVAAEHLATSISESIMNDLYENVIADNRVPYKVVLGCVENEQHQVGVKMVADIFEMHGWDTFFLGAGIPISELIDYASGVNPDVIALSLTIYSHLTGLEKMIVAIHQYWPHIPIIVGGQAFLHGGQEVVEKYHQVSLLRSFEEIEQYITKFSDHE